MPCPPKSFVSMIKSTLLSLSTKKEQPPFRFETNQELLTHNADVLKKYNFFLDIVVIDHRNNVLSPGSEFRAVFELRPLLHSHTN